MIDKLLMYLGYPFVQYALIVGVLVSLCASLLGVTLVLRRFSFIGDGLSHVAFGTMAIATVLKLSNNMLLVLPVTVLCAVLILKAGSGKRMKGDALTAVISVTALAFGYLIMNVFAASANVSGDVCATLFGSTSILTLGTSEVWMCIGLSAVVIAVFILMYNRLFSVTFDSDFAKATGQRPERYNLLISVLTAVVIVLGMNLVGSLLITALVVFPALSSMRLFGSFKAVTVSSVIMSVVCALAGMLISIMAGTPVGSTIVAANFVMFLACLALGSLARRGGK